MCRSVLILALVLGLARCLAAESLPADALDHLPPHPRLYADAVRWESLREQIKTDPASARIFALLRREADLFLTLPPVDYEKTGKRMLGPSREGRQRIGTLAAAARLTGDPRYRDRAVAEMRLLASLPDWNPSHFLDTAEATCALAFGYDWLHDELSSADRELIENAILRNGLQTSFDTDRRDLHWVRSVNNWNQVCHGGLVVGALAVAERDPALARRVIERALDGVPRAATAYAPDGIYPEGAEYWIYGTTYHVLMADALQSALGRSFGTDKYPGFEESADWYERVVTPTGKFFNYSDGGENPWFTPIMFWFARGMNRPDFMDEQMKRLPPTEAKGSTTIDLLAQTLIWRQPGKVAGRAAKERPLCWVGQGLVPLALLRTGYGDPKAVFVGFKGGSPYQSHAHMDVGSFILEADGVRWAVDPGSQDYESLESKGVDLWNKDGPRWEVFRLGSDAHSILRFDGGWQVIKARADFSRSRLTGDAPFVEADLSVMYADKVKGAHRGISLRQDRRVLIRDEWTAGDHPVKVAWQWMTRAEVETEATGAFLRQDGQTLRLRVLAPKRFTVTVEDASQPVRPTDAPNPGLKRIVVRMETPAGEAGALVVVAEPASATGELPEGLAQKGLREW